MQYRSVLDANCRILKVDDYNMNDIYYVANEYAQKLVYLLESNVKSDRDFDRSNVKINLSEIFKLKTLDIRK